MLLEFDFAKVNLTEFGVGYSDAKGDKFVAVPVDVQVQLALKEMAQATWQCMLDNEDGERKYEPSEKYAALENLYLPIEDELAKSISMIYEAATLDIQPGVLHQPSAIFCYFARFFDQNQRRLMALRRANQFKGILKNKNRLVRLVDDTLAIVEDTVFKLDNDFDILIDAKNIHILRPSGFEFAGKLRDAILAAVPENIKSIVGDISFIEFGSVELYAGKHPTAARYLASIRAQEETKNIDKSLLKRLCKQTGVVLTESEGKIAVAKGHEMGFLEVLDRRRYEISLVSKSPERFRAASRSKINE